jgi:hypothetical protein
MRRTAQCWVGREEEKSEGRENGEREGEDKDIRERNE